MEKFTHPQHGKYKVVGTRPIRHDGEDKVTGRAQYGADISFRDQLMGFVLRSPHAHARIRSIDTSAALAMPGVKAVITGKDIPAAAIDKIVDTGEGAENMKHMANRILAGDKALHKGHPIAAVAADDVWTAEEAAKAIKVDYEVLPAVVDVEEALKDGAPLVHDQVQASVKPTKAKAKNNICNHTRHERGDVEAAFAASDVVIEREFRTKTTHQGYIEPHNATAIWHSDGQITVWTSTQGAFPARASLSELLQVPLSKIKVVPMEIGGGFGGKIPVYLEPIAALLSRETGHPVKLVMSREDIFQATGPASATVSKIKFGAKKDGTLTAASAWMAFEAGAFPGNWGVMGAMCVLAGYKLDNVFIDVYDVCTNTTQVAAYRAPSSPQAMWGVESVVDELAEQLGMDKLEFRLKNAVEEGDKRGDGLVYPRIGLRETLEAAIKTDHWKSPAPKGKNQGRGVAVGFWFNAGLQSSATVGINMDGTASVVTGSVDIGGSRASMAIMAAETLGLSATDVSPSVADTDTIGHTDVTGGSRTTFATGYAVWAAAQDAIEKMKVRVAKLWDCGVDAISFEDGAFRDGAGKHKPMTVKDLAPQLTKTGGPVQGQASVAPPGVGAGFAVHIADLEVDPETGKTEVLRYTAVQDVGTAIHPAYVEGQIQGGSVQGIGWALNEEYVYDDQGRLMNAGFLDYRMPTFLDVPNIEVVLVEVPNPGHPYGVRGVGEPPIVPPMGAIHNAIANAIGVRVNSLPMSPPKLVAALKARQQPAAAVARA